MHHIVVWQTSKSCFMPMPCPSLASRYLFITINKSVVMAMINVMIATNAVLLLWIIIIIRVIMLKGKLRIIQAPDDGCALFRVLCCQCDDNLSSLLLCMVGAVVVLLISFDHFTWLSIIPSFCSAVSGINHWLQARPKWHDRVHRRLKGAIYYY